LYTTLQKYMDRNPVWSGTYRLCKPFHCCQASDMIESCCSSEKGVSINFV